ncbi:MAG: hypothetical protein KDD60_04775 [Bdellovibrionales bacterium]|nr:hypothetical protein [Bdellovibrionales bacterium]
MDQLELREAQLFRLLSECFGKDRIIPKARISLVCGGNLPRLPEDQQIGYHEWVTGYRCLFTVINADDQPRLVVEFFSGFTKSIDPHEAERQRFLPSVLRIQKILYLTISDEEFSALLSPEEDVSLWQLIECKLGDELEAL